MSRAPESTFRVGVDPTNPGQFFACCGLLELADRLWGGAEGWFDNHTFVVSKFNNDHPIRLNDLLDAISEASLRQVDPEDKLASPIEITEPFNLRLDWWKDTLSNGRHLKAWAGSMSNFRIARAMQNALHRSDIQNEALFDHSMVVYEPMNSKSKVEPFYFDARRGANASSLDIGFSPDKLKMPTKAFPAIEFLSLVGLQRCRPAPTEIPRVLEYYTWNIPLEIRLASPAVCGLLPHVGLQGFRFQIIFRSDQRKQKAFLPAIRLQGERNDRPTKSI